MESPKKGPIKVKVHDKRRVADDKPAEPEASSENQQEEPTAVIEGEVVEASPAGEDEPQSDLLEQLKRERADFDNYRKRMMKEQSAIVQRGVARVIEGLLPILDDFERALEHDPDPGVELIYRHLKDALAAQGLVEIDAEGQPFDPSWHDAVDFVEDNEVTEEVCRKIYRRGYRVGEQLLRPAMVVVARPPEGESTSEQAAEA